MKTISAEQIEQTVDYKTFVPYLRQAFTQQYMVPPRHHHNYVSGAGEEPSTLLLMPAWTEGQYLGVKMVTVSPHNTERQLPSIQGTYTLFSAETGEVVALLDAKALTNKRTAAASALASSFLSHPEAHTLLMVGTGDLAPELIKAHCTVRPIKKVLIWGRTAAKAEALAKRLQLPGVECQAVADLDKAVPQAAIISTATLSQAPLVLGKWLQPGQHLDLVGAYRPDMRESDDECIRKATVFCDNLEMAPKEGGDLAVPIAEGTLAKDDIAADLFWLCGGRHQGRESLNEITLFKSVGHALEDLAGALYLMGGE